MAKAYEYKPERPQFNGSSLKQGTTEASGLMIVLIILAVIGLVVGLFTNAFYATIVLAASAVLAIFARIAQAGRQHAEMMDALRELKQRLPESE